MAGAADSINAAPPAIEPPEKLRHLGRAFGVFQGTRQEEDCQIALVGDRQVVLPQDLDISGYVGQRVGIMRYNDRILIRRLPQ